MKQINAIIFDVGGTLTDYFTLFNKIDQQLLKEQGISVSLKKIRKITKEIDGKYAEKVSKLPGKKLSYFFSTKIVKKLNIKFDKLTEKNVINYHADNFSKRVDWNKLKLFPDVLPVIKKLKKNFRIVTLSNTDDTVLHEQLLRKLKLFNHFEFHTDSDRSKSMKPAKKVFIYVIKKLDLTPEEIAIVGDTPFSDIIGGNQMGMLTVLLNRRKIKYELKKDLKSDYEIYSLKELLKIKEIKEQIG